MSTSEITRHDNSGRGAITRQEFGAQQVEQKSETAASSIAARQQAIIQARCLMAERHPRIWQTVRIRLLEHCDRPRFCEVARYKKPTGKKKVNGQWVESFAEGLSARFAEVARQEMGNTESFSSVVFEDDLIRIVQAGVSDIERNSHESREVTLAKVIEKRGQKRGDQWTPPEGRDIIGEHPRINSYGEPVWLVRATDDELRSKQNSEISKTQRDATLRLIPKDIRDECEDRVIATLADPKKIDPGEVKKRIMDGFAKLGVMPDDLITYFGAEIAKFSPAQWDELRGLGVSIRDGETSFQEALERKMGRDEDGSHDEQDAVAERKIADAKAKQEAREKKVEMPAPVEPDPNAPLSAEDHAAMNAKAASEEHGKYTAPSSEKPKFGFGGNKK